jgi:hypothetical protein
MLVSIEIEIKFTQAPIDTKQGHAFSWKFNLISRKSSYLTEMKFISFGSWKFNLRYFISLVNKKIEKIENIMVIKLKSEIVQTTYFNLEKCKHRQQKKNK